MIATIEIPVAVASQELSLGELLAQGGVAMLPIYACSIVGLAVFVRKLYELRAAQLGHTAWLDAVLDALAGGDHDAAARSSRASRHPGARVVEAMLHALERRPDQLEAEAKRVGSLELQRLERTLGLLSLLSQIAPLLGLLGTVLGMVDLFMDLQGAEHGNLAVGDLASGIWKALLTTVAGLTVAVPALAGHAWIASRIDALRLQLADIIQRVRFVLPVGTEERAS